MAYIQLKPGATVASGELEAWVRERTPERAAVPQQIILIDPMPYSRVRVVKLDADGRYQRDCASNEIGVVAMAGPGVFGGYLNDAHNKDAFVEPGWVNSGDLGRLDEDGYLWITGRAKDTVILLVGETPVGLAVLIRKSSRNIRTRKIPPRNGPVEESNRIGSRRS